MASKLILVAGGVAVLAAAGWYGWHQFYESGPSPAATAVPTPKPKRPTSAPKPTPPDADAQGGAAAPVTAAQTSTPADRDRLIDEVLTATGLGEQLDGLPEEVVAAVKQGFASQPQRSPVLSKEMERIVAESFTAQGFQRRVRESLKANYDEKQLRTLLSAASTPVAKKMTRLELAKPSQTELASYFDSLASNPLPPQRKTLLEQLDEASNASILGTEIALASMRAMALGASGSNPNMVSQIDRVVENQRPALSESIRKASVVAMAYTYREATDADLSEYIKIYQSDHGKWFMNVVSAAMVAEFKSAAGEVGEKVVALVKGKQPATSAMAQSDDPASASRPESGGASPDGGRRTVAVRQGSRNQSKDLRRCLDLPTTAEVIKCAEQGR